MMPIISIRELSFAYSRSDGDVFDNFSLSVDVGECIGILGHNGAGKTTLLKLIYGVLKPSHGDVRINMHDVSSYRHIFLLSDKFGLDRQVSLRENLKFRKRLFHVKEFEDLKAYWTGRFDFAGHLDRRILALSSGLEMRAQLIAGLCLGPQLLLLDEPTNSIDPATRETVISVLHEIHSQGRTCLFVTHDLDFARRASSRVVTLQNGTIVDDDPVGDETTLDEFTERYLHMTDGSDSGGAHD